MIDWPRVRTEACSVAFWLSLLFSIMPVTANKINNYSKVTYGKRNKSAHPQFIGYSELSLSTGSMDCQRFLWSGPVIYLSDTLKPAFEITWDTEGFWCDSNAFYWKLESSSVRANVPILQYYNNNLIYLEKATF